MKGPQGMDVLSNDCYQGELSLLLLNLPGQPVPRDQPSKQWAQGGRPINNKLQLSSSPQRAAKAPYKASRQGIELTNNSPLPSSA